MFHHQVHFKLASIHRVSIIAINILGSGRVVESTSDDYFVLRELQVWPIIWNIYQSEIEAEIFHIAFRYVHRIAQFPSAATKGQIRRVKISEVSNL